MSVALALVAASVMTAALAGAATAAEYNVVEYGARPGGRADSAAAFLGAWAAACNDSSSSPPPVMRVPAGRFLVSQAYFKGPCRSAAGVVVAVHGVVVAPATVDCSAWIMFHYAHGLKIRGGTLDGRGRAYWACKAAGRRCPHGTTTLDISQSRDVNVKRQTLVNSKEAHMFIFDCTGVTLRGVKMLAPGDSPNTDGVNVQFSTHVRILAATIRTGDDCVSLGPGTSDVVIRNIKCGPGHGISIGSLSGKAGEAPVRNVTVERAALTGTQNGLRIKTWGKHHRGLVAGVSFVSVTMRGVQNPILVDQNYCPHNVSCPGQSSGVKISDVKFRDIKGTSATPVAVRFDCSSSYLCTGIQLEKINLTDNQGKPAQSVSKNAYGSSTGGVRPPSCL